MDQHSDPEYYCYNYYLVSEQEAIQVTLVLQHTQEAKTAIRTEY